jgi:hypothetical protein
MPLTFSQGRYVNLMNSIKEYCANTIITPYNAAAAAAGFPNPLGIELAKPPDPKWIPNIPLIVFDYPTDAKPPESFGLGGGAVWKCKQFRFNFYPALTADQQPSLLAKQFLLDYVEYALQTGIYIPVKDYTPFPAVLTETMEIVDCRIIHPMRMPDEVLNIEKTRFDAFLTLKIPAVAVNG